MIDVKNRLPTKPNRWKITHESDSSEEYITWAYADEPTEVGTPINRGLYSDIYNNDIAPIGKINFYSRRDDATRTEEGFIYCDGSLITTIDYPDISSFANTAVALDTGKTLGYTYAGCDYSTSTEKLYFYKVTSKKIEVFQTTDLETFTKVTEYTATTTYSPRAEYKNGAIIFIWQSSTQANSTRYFAVTIDNSHFTTFDIASYNGNFYFDYNNKHLVAAFPVSSAGAANVRTYTILDEGGTATYTSLSGVNTPYAVTYDKTNSLWLISSKQSSDGYGVINVSSDNGETFTSQVSSAAMSNIRLAYNEYSGAVYYMSTINAGKVYEITDMTDIFNNLNQVYNGVSTFGAPATANVSLKAKYPCLYYYASSTAYLMANFWTVRYLDDFNPKAMFALGNKAYVVASSNNKLYEIDCTNKQGYLLPDTTGVGTRCYGYMKVEVIY